MSSVANMSLSFALALSMGMTFCYKHPAILVSFMKEHRLSREYVDLFPASRDPDDTREGRLRVLALKELAETKGRVATEVIEGRRTLLQAAAEFRHCDTAIRISPSGPRRETPVAYCREVITWVSADGKAPPGTDVKQVAQRLQLELNQRIRNGTVVLPAPGPRLHQPARSAPPPGDAS